MNATIKLFIALFVMFFYEFVCNFVEYIDGNAYFFIGTSILLAGWINADNDIPYYYIVKEENHECTDCMRGKSGNLQGISEERP